MTQEVSSAEIGLRLGRGSQRSERRRRVVVTGLGLIAPSGIGRDSFWQLLVSGSASVHPVTRFDVTEYPVQSAAQILDFDPREHMSGAKARLAGRFSQLVIAAARLAVADAGLGDHGPAVAGAGLLLGTALGAVEITEGQSETFLAHGPRSVARTLPFTLSPHSGAVLAASEIGLLGLVSTTSSECPAGLDAVAAAARLIGSGELDVALAGAAEAPITPLLFAGFARSGALASDGDAPEAAGRPFDRRRSGFVLGEAGAMLVLESLEHAEARGAYVYGELLGRGRGRDQPTHPTDANPSGHGFLVAARRALSDAGLEPKDVDLVSAHAPGIRGTDLAEIRALIALLGSRHARVPVTSIKGAVGHALAAGGVLQLAATLLGFAHGSVPPTRNCTHLDAECDLDVVRRASRPFVGRIALVNSHGFGGHTTSLIVGAGMGAGVTGRGGAASSSGLGS